MIYDVVVVGGGTAGCAAAYTAGKLGLKTLIIEKNIHLGGTITSGLVIPVMRSGNNQINTDFRTDLIEELRSLGGQTTYQNNPAWFNPELTKIALDNLMRKANVEVFFDTHIIGVKIENREIKRIKISKEILSVSTDEIDMENKNLSVSIGARYVIDSTGNCEIGKISNCRFLEKQKEFQPVTLRFMMAGIDLMTFSEWLKNYDTDRNVTTVEHIDGHIHLSTAYTWDKDKKWALEPLFADAVEHGILKRYDTNYFQIFTVPGMPDTVAFNCPRIIDYNNSLEVKNISKALLIARQNIYRYLLFCRKYFPGFKNAYISNIADMLGVRVSRRIRGKYIYTIDDLKSGKKFDNPVVISDYPVDVHSNKQNRSTLQNYNEYQLPLECLMSADIDNLFVAGRCLSADYMAQGALRVQSSCFSMGEGIAKYIRTLVRP
ncbi:TPA: FAD-dependent oxidoreductase [Candidatus Scatousia excrementigallinarum]|uniref:FAD-dependent oxidoreductase n=1 Tax=Candidatus Scatousia excrementigallinarum TaxID=2840935 RepID=A0A9D1EX27_9BACT|nr:FAD-dependent oxidoreductase [Candidatus Scatousia excrementigallinarum]